MLNLAVARRYAQALFTLAQEKGQVDRIEQDLSLIVAAGQEKNISLVLNNRLLDPQVKADMLNKLFSDKVSSITMSFLGVLLRRRREFFLGDIAKEYSALANAARGLLEVEVRSAVPLREQDLASLNQRLTTRLGKKIVTKAAVDPSLVGGVVVQVGDLLLDGSLSTRIKRLRERLARANVSV